MDSAKKATSVFFLLQNEHRAASKNVRECSDDVDLKEKNRGGLRVECYDLSGDVYSPTTPVQFKPWDGERPQFWVVIEQNIVFL